jgi:hypothetical protein
MYPRSVTSLGKMRVEGATGWITTARQRRRRPENPAAWVARSIPGSVALARYRSSGPLRPSQAQGGVRVHARLARSRSLCLNCDLHLGDPPLLPWRPGCLPQKAWGLITATSGCTQYELERGKARSSADWGNAAASALGSRPCSSRRTLSAGNARLASATPVAGSPGALVRRKTEIHRLLSGQPCKVRKVAWRYFRPGVQSRAVGVTAMSG